LYYNHRINHSHFKQSRIRNPSAPSDSATTESENVFERLCCEEEEENPGPKRKRALTLDLTMNTSGAVMEAINSSGTGGIEDKSSKYLAYQTGRRRRLQEAREEG
jgi:hypothetical protein